MPAAVRLTDVCSGHGCFPSRPNVQASPNVIINGRGSHRLTDKWAVHCLVGSTKILLLSGVWATIAELAADYLGEYVYSCTEDGRIVPGKIVDAFLSSTAGRTLRITLDNSESFECSSDHLVMLRDGSYIKAKHIRENDSLMPLYMQLDEYGYENIWDNHTESWVPTHKMSALSKPAEQLRAKKVIGKRGNKFLVVHHVNFNKFDNRPSNLKWMGNQDHFKYHSVHGHNIWKNMPEKKQRKLRKLRSEIAKRITARQLAAGIHNFQTNHPMWYAENQAKIVESNRRRLDNGTHHFVSANPMKRPEIAKKVSVAKRVQWAEKTEDELESFRLAASIRQRKLVRSGRHHLVTDNPMKDPERKRAMCMAKIVRIYKAIRSAGLAFTKETYEEFYFASAPGWKKMKTYFSSLRQLAEYAKYNHSVVKVEVLKHKKPVPLYDLTIENAEGTHNFALSAGVFVHNCCLLCHASQAASGSPNVIVNNLNKCRIGDAVACGSTMVQGSPNVIVNG